jgi:hypothetical protein
MRYVYTFIVFLLLLSQSHASDLIHHDIIIQIDPDKGFFSAEDKIYLPERHQETISFFIHKGFNPEIINWDKEEKEKPELIRSGMVSDHLESFKIVLSSEIKTITLKYGGVIRHPLEEEEGRAGSKFFVRNYKDINKCIAMINLDTVGRLFDKKLLIIGTYTSDDWIPILMELAYKD